MIIVTKNSGLSYRKVVTTDCVRLVSGDSEVVIARKPTAEGRVNIIVGDDIDLENSNQIVWALSMRLRPDKDVAFGDNGKIVVDTTRMTKGLEIPSLSHDIIERISHRLPGDGR
jgi:3-octaprenyl-4-hydroxybenzoate carboxy-lyase